MASRRKIEESSKSPKNLKGLKKLCRPPIRRNVYRSTDPPSVHRYEELELTSELRQFGFSSSFCWAQKLSRGHFRFNYRQGKVNGAADALSRFSPVGGRSSSREHSNPSTDGPSAPSFCLRNARPPSATSVLEMRSGRRRPSERKCLMAGGMSRQLLRPVLHS